MLNSLLLGSDLQLDVVAGVLGGQKSKNDGNDAMKKEGQLTIPLDLDLRLVRKVVGRPVLEEKWPLLWTVLISLLAFSVHIMETA